MSSSTKSLRMSWDRLTSKTLGVRRKKAGKKVSAGRDETSASTTTLTDDADDVADDASSRPPPIPPPPPARPPALAPGVTATVDSAAPSTSREEDDEDDKGAVFSDALDTMLHADAHPDGGLALADRRLLVAHRAAVGELVKEFGRSLLLGRLDLQSLSLPLTMFEPRSYLQKLTDAWTHPRFLEEASRPELSGDAVARVKLVATWFVAGLQHAFESWRKPFNPILGETWAGRLRDGSEIFLEQTSHHPPVSAFQLVGPGRRYVFSGLSEPSVGLKGVDVKTTAKGARSVVFGDDGLRIHVTFPAYLMRGVLSGGAPRGEMQGKAAFVAPDAGVAAEIVFGKSNRPEHRNDPLLQRSDTVTGSVYRLVGGSLGGGGAERAADDGDDGGGDESEDDPFAAADAAAEARRRRRQQSKGASSSTPSLFGSATGRSSGAWGGSSSSLSLSSFASALGNLSGGSGSAASLSAAATTGCGNDPSTHAGGATRGETLATCSGNWLSHLDWDGRRAWTLAEEVPEVWEPLASPSSAELPLPSDAGNRGDLRALAAAFDAVGDGGITADPAGVAAAQRAKEALEVAQRADAKLRKEGRSGGGGK